MPDKLMRHIAVRTARILAKDMRGIVPDRCYPPKIAAELMGIESARGGKTLKEIPQALLPMVTITPGGKLKGYMGRDMLRYLDDQRGGAARTIEEPAAVGTISMQRARAAVRRVTAGN